MISTRYIPMLCVLLAIGLVPTLIHSYAGVIVADARTTAAISPTLAGFTSTPTSRNNVWARGSFDSFDWLERRYQAGTDEVVLTAIRSYDLKRLYHHPELDIAYGASFLRHETRRFAHSADIPANILYSDVEDGPIAIYALHYDDRFVADPVMFQIRTAAELLFEGRRPMTLFFAHDTRVPRGANLETLPAVRLLFEAIEQFVKNGG